MKSKEELNALKEEIAALGKKLSELTEDELAQVSGGHDMPSINHDEKYVMTAFVIPDENNDKQYEIHIYK